MKLQASPVKQFALAHGMAVAQPHSLKLDGKYLPARYRVVSALSALGRCAEAREALVTYESLASAPADKKRARERVARCQAR